MTLIELFPWLLSVVVVMFATSCLRHSGWSDYSAFGIGFILGVISWVLYVLGLKGLVEYAKRKRTRKESGKGHQDAGE